MTGIQIRSITIAKIVTLLVAILTQIFLSWQLGAGGLGSYALSIMYASLLSVVFVVGCDVASSYLLSSGNFNVSESVLYTTIFGGIGSLIAILVGLSLLQFPIPLFSKAGYIPLYFSLASIPATLFSTVYVQLFSAMQEFKIYAQLTIIQAVLLSLLNLLFVYIFSMGVPGALLALIISGLVVICFALFIFKKKYELKFSRIKRTNLTKMLNYGMRYYLGRLSNTANAQIGVLMLGLFLPKESVGVFSLATQLISRIMIIPETLHVLLSPKAASSADGEAQLIALSSRFTALISAILLVLIYFLSEPFVKLIYPSQFSEAILIIRILTVGILFRCVSKIYVPYFLGVDLPGVASLSVFSGLVLTIFAYTLLVPNFGLAGAGIGTVLGYTLSSFLLYLNFVKRTGLTFQECLLFDISDWRMASLKTKALLKNK
jgi:O-antigen/teichoic acid export membrane protein